MSAFARRIEVAANVAIVVVALLLGGVLVRKYLLDAPAPERAAAEGVAPGTKVTLPDLDWSQKEAHLLLVLHRECRYCTESAPFYRRLAQAAGERADVQLVAVLPHEVDAGLEYLSKLEVSVAEVRRADPSALGARGTPTLLLVDKTGTVTGAWVGKLPPEKESEVFERLRAGR
jgi:hypothetical protein